MATLNRLSRLQAVNRIIRAAGEQPVNSLTDDGINDTLTAETILDECTLKHLIEMHLETTAFTRTYQPDDNGYILLPQNTLSVDAVDPNVHVVQRGTTSIKLWDIDNDTYVFEEDVEIRVVFGMKFDELPAASQFAIADAAAVEYQMLMQGDALVNQHLSSVALRSNILARQEDSTQKDRSLFSNMRTNAYWAVRRHAKQFIDRGN